MASPAQGVRPPLQRRSRERLERLLEAGERVLAREGHEGFVVTEVAREANVPVGTIYQRFENKDAFIREIHRRLIQRLLVAEDDIALSAESALSLEQAVSIATHGLADAMRREKQLLRTFVIRGAVDPNIDGLASEASQAIAEAFTQALLAHSDEIRHPEPELAVDVAFRIVYDVLIRLVMRGPTFESKRKIGWDSVVDQLIVACVAYLQHGTALNVGGEHRPRSRRARPAT